MNAFRIWWRAAALGGLLAAGCAGEAEAPAETAHTAARVEAAAPARTAPAAQRIDPASLPPAFQPQNDRRDAPARLRDASTAARIQLALADEKALAGAALEPRVVGGAALLVGEAPSQAAAAAALAAASGVEGVRQVLNGMSIAAAPPAAPEDAFGLIGYRAAPASAAAPREQTAPRQPAPATPDPVQSAPATAKAAPPKTPPKAAPKADKKPATHTVRKGDTLWGIAQRYGVTAAQLKKLNGKKANTLRPGQTLRLR